MEKNQQVALMSQIYRNAVRTIAWLGEDADLAASCLADINEVQTYIDSDKNSSIQNRNVSFPLVLRSDRFVLD
jgi:hypothetical protein